MVTTVDDRTEEQKTALVTGIAVTDRLLSIFPGSKGKSVAVWAFNPISVDANKVWDWLKKQPHYKRVRVVSMRNYRPKCGHLHIYVVDKGHPSQC